MEILEWIRFFIGSFFLLFGLLLFAIEMYGVYRFDFVLNRMHAAAMGDTLGISSCLIGLIIFSGFTFTSVKLFLVVVFLWFASPVASHLLSKLEVNTNDKIDEHCEIQDTLQNEKEKEG